MACNEPSVAGFAPDRSVVRFEWTTPLPRYWKLPFWLPRFQRARYLFLSESDRQEFLRDHSLIPREVTNAIPYYVDSQLFKPAPSPAHADGAPLRVGFAGQWLPGKGCLTLLEAWNIIRSQHPQAELWFAGGDKLWKTDRTTPGSVEVAEAIHQAAAEGSVKLVGELKRTEMPGFWSPLDLAVVPSFVEAFGLVALEAMACGVPVIASKIGGLKEIVQEGVSGLLVPAGDSAALANSIIYLLNNKQLRLSLAEGARRRAQEYSVERRSGELLSLIQG
jgi:D-inositol-3-phosphate glycosyltransferase